MVVAELAIQRSIAFLIGAERSTETNAAPFSTDAEMRATTLSSQPKNCVQRGTCDEVIAFVSIVSDEDLCADIACQTPTQGVDYYAYGEECDLVEQVIPVRAEPIALSRRLRLRMYCV